MACFGYDTQKSYINRNLKRYGPDYYCERNKDGILCVFRKNKRAVLAAEWDGFTLYNLIDSPEFVFALTDNWKTTGKPREWGSEHVLLRLKETDWWANPNLLDEMDKQNAKIDEAKARDLRNQTESYLADNHSVFKKAFADINTANLSKREARKINKDKRRF